MSDRLSERMRRYGTALAMRGDHGVTATIDGFSDEVAVLETDLQYAWTCPHGNDYRDRSCLECWGDGTEVISDCDTCNAGTWHRGGVCLRHDLETAPKPYEALREVVLEAERISTEAHLAADTYGYDLMRTVLRPLEYDSD